MRVQLILPLAALASLGLAAGGVLARPMAASATSPAFSGHKLAGAARVSLAQARGIALKAHPGAVTGEELEKEGGGSGLRYSFDIKSAGVAYEVGVDAKSGAVLENDRDTGND
ncbi:MAG TPA: PepSY domain-containing protein [Caulobacteraceae bacterium]|nr:PepSY domain-containing protein [Caulobacteraceae bacterium]